MKSRTGFILLIILQLFLYADRYLLNYLNILRSITYNSIPYVSASFVSFLLFGLLIGLAASYGFHRENLSLLIILLLLNIGTVAAAALIVPLYFLNSASFFLILAGFMLSGIIKVRSMPHSV